MERHPNGFSFWSPSSPACELPEALPESEASAAVLRPSANLSTHAKVACCRSALKASSGWKLRFTSLMFRAVAASFVSAPMLERVTLNGFYKITIILFVFYGLIDRFRPFCFTSSNGLGKGIFRLAVYALPKALIGRLKILTLINRRIGKSIRRREFPVEWGFLLYHHLGRHLLRNPLIHIHFHRCFDHCKFLQIKIVFHLSL